jgi:hypothetical protein
MQLILALPALFEARADKTAASPAPALAELIALAGAPARQQGGIAAVLAAHYGVAKQSDWPLAAIRLAALGVPPGDACWLTADPVSWSSGARARSSPESSTISIAPKPKRCSRR